MKEDPLYVRFAKEEAITKALDDEEFTRKDIAKVLNVSIRTVSRRLASANKRMEVQTRNVSVGQLSSEALREVEDIVSKAIQAAPSAGQSRPRCPECGDPRPYLNGVSWQCRACGKTWMLNPREDPEEFKDRPECPDCGARHARSKADRWSCGRCGAQWYKKPDRRTYRKS
jgi:ribosomal protein S27AE